MVFNSSFSSITDFRLQAKENLQYILWIFGNINELCQPDLQWLQMGVIAEPPFPGLQGAFAEHRDAAGA